MSKVLFVLALLMLSVFGCAPAETAATEGPSDMDEPPTSIPASEELTPVQRAAIRTLAGNLGISEDAIALVSTEAEDWPDDCLGIREEGLMCTQTITPGFQIMLEANGRQVEYRTNEDGTLIRPATVLMTWKREGGFAGFCDNMTVYLSGELHRSSCKQGPAANERLIDILSTDEILQLENWANSYGNISVDASDPKGVSDRMIVTLEFIGLGNQETLSAANEKELLEFAQSLNQSLPHQ